MIPRDYKPLYTSVETLKTSSNKEFSFSNEEKINYKKKVLPTYRPNFFLQGDAKQRYFFFGLKIYSVYKNATHANET